MSHERCECHECTQARYRLANPLGSIQDAMTNNPLMNWNNAPPRCLKHNQPMILGFYERPGSRGNGWICQARAGERAARAQTEQAVAKDAAHTEVVDKSSRGGVGEPSGERAERGARLKKFTLSLRR